MRALTHAPTPSASATAADLRRLTDAYEAAYVHLPRKVYLDAVDIDHECGGCGDILSGVECCASCIDAWGVAYVEVEIEDAERFAAGGEATTVRGSTPAEARRLDALLRAAVAKRAGVK